MRAVVTGGAGFVGSHLAARGDQLTALDPLRRRHTDGLETVA